MAGAGAGGAILLAGVLAVAAYAVAGDPLSKTSQPVADGAKLPASTTSAAQAHVALPLTRDTATQGNGQPADPDPGTDDFARYFFSGKTVQLAPSDLALLRTRGWACPELDDLGFRLVAAQASVRSGHATVELHLSNGNHNATVVEEHPRTDAARLGSDALQVSGGTPWHAVYRTPDAVFTYDSDLPAAQADDAVPELMQAADALNNPSESTARPSENVLDRIQRGLRSIAGLAGF